jgi:ATP-binding cassette subfamily B multidrug efflux pump
MTNVNWQLTVFVFLPLPFLSFMIYKVSDLINQRSTKVQEELSNLTSHAQETFSAIRVIKAYAQEKFFSDTFEKKGENYKSLNLKLARTEAYFQPTMVFTIGLSILITTWYGGYLVIQGKIEAGNITEFILYVFRLTWPFASLGWVTSLVQRAAASQERINEFLQTASRIRNETPENGPVSGDIEFRNVSFTYPESGIKALQNVSFSLKKGQTLGITGPVGSGKSTMAQLLSRFYDADHGEILINNAPIQEHNLFTLRKSTGVVPQEVFLFSDTIFNNISFSGEMHFPKEAVEQAAKDAAVYENIIHFPNKFDTLVGERGITLSGGQKQRVSIARAILNKPGTLIFDDCLSAVDTETESLIIGNLKRLMKDKTCVIISQRISSIKHADKIIYLKNGRIAEYGSHEELLSLRGDYFNLFELQKN